MHCNGHSCHLAHVCLHVPEPNSSGAAVFCRVLRRRRGKQSPCRLGRGQLEGFGHAIHHRLESALGVDGRPRVSVATSGHAAALWEVELTARRAVIGEVIAYLADEEREGVKLTQLSNCRYPYLSCHAVHSSLGREIKPLTGPHGGQRRVAGALV